MKRSISISVLWLALLFSYLVKGQSMPQHYIEEGIKNNLVLQQRETDLEKSLLAIKVARSYYLPTTWLEGQYMVAKGGRSIDIPVGDLLNPVYQTLNQLTSGHNFPSIQNVSEQLTPNNFYDLRVRTTLPLVNTDIKWNTHIQQQQSVLQKNEIEIYKRELVKEIKTAYYHYLLSQKAIAIYRSAMEVVNQNLQVNQSLLKNGRGLPAYVSRAESEVQKVQTDLQNAMNASQNAKAYFNFLLNKPLTDSIIIANTPPIDLSNSISSLATYSTEKREEMKSINTAIDINQLVGKMHRSYRTPKINAFLDLASQGKNFNLNNKTIYYLGGVQASIPIFTGKRNFYKINQTEIEAKNLRLKESHLKQQLELSALTSRNNIINAYNGYHSTEKQRQAAQQYFKLIDRGYREGVNSFLEYLDARNSLTSSELNFNINYYKVLVALADYERQTASYSLQ